MRIAKHLIAATALVAATTAQSQVPPPADAGALSKVYPGSTYSPYAGQDFANESTGAILTCIPICLWTQVPSAIALT